MTVNKLYTDVVIIGGGPAGASAALSFLNYSDLKVALIEKSGFDQIRVGEHVTPGLFSLLEYLQIDKSEFEPGSFIPSFGSVSYWGNEYPTSADSIFSAEGATVQLNREKFDLKLIRSVAQKGGIVLPRTKCVNFEQTKNKSWELTLKHPEKGTIDVNTKYLIDASGRMASVSRQVGIESNRMDSLVGVSTFMQVNADKAITQEQLLETTELGWWYTAVLPGSKLVAVFFTDADIVAKHKLNKSDPWNELLNNTTQIKHRLRKAGAIATKPLVRNAFTQITDSTKRDRFIAIGDAASSYDPISSMGIGFAISSACHAARFVMHQFSTDKYEKPFTYQQNISNNFSDYLKIRKQFYQQEKRWATSEFWRRRRE